MKPPNKIYLQWVWDDEYKATWCQDKINDTDEAYVLDSQLESLKGHYNDQGIELAELRERHETMSQEWVESAYERFAEHEALKQLTNEYLDETEHLVGGPHAVVSEKRKLLFDRLREMTTPTS